LEDVPDTCSFSKDNGKGLVMLRVVNLRLNIGFGWPSWPRRARFLVYF